MDAADATAPHQQRLVCCIIHLTRRVVDWRTFRHLPEPEPERPLRRPHRRRAHLPPPLRPLPVARTLLALTHAASRAGSSRNRIRLNPSSTRMIFKHDGALNLDHTYIIGSGHNQLTQDLTTGLAPLVISYDANGSRIHEVGDTVDRAKHYYYDGMNRLSGTFEWVAGLQHDRPNDCQYDADGQLVAACEGGPFLGFDGANVSGALAVGGKGWTFFHGPGLDSPLMGYYRNLSAGAPSRILYWVSDGSGRELAVADSAGLQQSTDQGLDIRNWNQAGGITSSYGFSNQRQPNVNATNLSFYRNRVYDQDTGRWLQEDPAGLAGGVNLYQFNGNNPVAYTDPFGLCPEPPGSCEALGFAIGSGVGVAVSVVADFASDGLLIPSNPGIVETTALLGGTVGTAIGGVMSSADKRDIPDNRKPHKEGASESTREKHENTRNPSKDKKRQHDNWQQNPNKRPNRTVLPIEDHANE